MKHSDITGGQKPKRKSGVSGRRAKGQTQASISLSKTAASLAKVMAKLKTDGNLSLFLSELIEKERKRLGIVLPGDDE